MLLPDGHTFNSSCHVAPPKRVAELLYSRVQVWNSGLSFPVACNTAETGFSFNHRTLDS